MNRYLFEYELQSTGFRGEFSWVEESEEKAKEAVRERIADLEFTELEDVIVGKLLKTMDASNRYFECENCAS
ncbi:hypothetical protein [Paenibacillus sp. 453mf]|uniref:hypothetical protein n=1 Tax=Paenibacillus sp. 453mf TaxID=1761874 RepID=UPI0008F2B9F4|nr:hypothetical protein [Paenibacillus sp. 453mf]SFS70073.1 hypothetical protein SAMN04488601_10273 [Paenibacillus sp. 453mf]